MNLDDIPIHWDITFTHISRFTVKPSNEGTHWICRLWDPSKEDDDEGIILFYGRGITPSLALNDAIEGLREEDEKREKKKSGFKTNLHIFLEDIKKKK